MPKMESKIQFLTVIRRLFNVKVSKKKRVDELGMEEIIKFVTLKNNGYINSD